MAASYLSRIRLRSDAAVAGLAPVLLPAAADARAGVGHRLMWTLFTASADRGGGGEERRQFLWRERASGSGARTTFYVLSPAPPVDQLNLFDIETRPFAPALAPGDRLRFSLRANPVVARRHEGTGRPRRDDVVMARLHALPPQARSEARAEAIAAAGAEWLGRQAAAAGFRLASSAAPNAAAAENDGTVALRSPVRVDGYEQFAIPRGRERPIRFSVLDFEGIIVVDDPDRFVRAISAGFGKAKAFGCGLMLIRRL